MVLWLVSNVEVESCIDFEGQRLINEKVHTGTNDGTRTRPDASILEFYNQLTELIGSAVTSGVQRTYVQAESCEEVEVEVDNGFADEVEFAV